MKRFFKENKKETTGVGIGLHRTELRKDKRPLEMETDDRQQPAAGLERECVWMCVRVRNLRSR